MVFVKLDKPKEPQPFYHGESSVPFYLGLRKNERQTKPRKKLTKMKSNKVKVMQPNPLRRILDATMRAESGIINYHNQFTP
jgi:hypothetical protein